MAEPNPNHDAFVPSYALLSERVRKHYLGYYKLVFDDGALDMKTKELIALGVSLATGAENCAEGHMKKVVELGATRAEVEAVVAVTLGVAAASVVDRADIAHKELRARLDGLFGDAPEDGR